MAKIGMKKKEKKAPYWYQGMEFQCRVCSEMFYDGMDLADHAVQSHGMDSDKYKKTFGKFASKEASYACQVCDENIKHVKIVIEWYVQSIE